MKGVLFSLLVSFLRRFLTEVAYWAGQNLWDTTWTLIFQAIEEAERRWRASNHGQKKKEFVVTAVLEKIKDRTTLNWFQERALRLFISMMADAIVHTLNEELGHKWLKQTISLERRMADKIPFIQ